MKSITRLVLSASVALAISGCHTAYDSGLEQLASGDYQQAAKFAQEGLKEDPNDPELNLLMAEALVGDGLFAPAEPYARRAFKSESFKAPAGRTLGKVLWELGQPIAAVDAWRVARAAQADVVSDDDFIRGLEIAISTAMSIHEFQQALDLRDELAVLSPDHSDVAIEARRRNREDLAEEDVRSGKLEAASIEYAALFKDFHDARYEFERGRVLLTLNDPVGATKAFENYIASDGQEVRVDRAIAVADRAQKMAKPIVAVDFYDRALVLMKDETSMRRAKIHLTQAGLLLASRADDQGKAQLREYIAQMRQMNGSPVNADTFMQAANVAAENRAPELAIAFLEEALVEGTSNWRAARMLAELYARRSRNADVERVLKLYVERSEDKVTAQISVGRWAASRRNFDLAVFFLEAAVEPKDASANLWLELARTYAATGRLDDMRRSLDAYLKKAGETPNALADVAGLYAANRMYEQAEKTLKIGVKNDPKAIESVQSLERLYREWGRNAKIHAVYDAFIKARGSQAADYSMVASRFMRQNEWDDALPYLLQAAAKGEGTAWLQVADVYKKQRKERDMKEALSKFLTASSDRQSALEEVWQRYRTSNWSHEGIPILEELVTLQPNNVVYYEELSELYFQQGRDVESFELWKRFLEKAKDPVMALESMARRFERRGHDEWMLSLLERMADREGDARPELYRLLGDAHYAAAQRRGRIQFERDDNVIFSAEDRARTYYKTYLAKASPKPRELESFANSLRLKRLWDVAAIAYERLDMTRPEMTDELLAYGVVLLSLGRPQDAVSAFADYDQRRGKSMDAARQIADVLAPAKQFTALEPYLRRLLESGDENQLRNAFIQLSEVYRQTDRPKDIGKLITDYLARSQNPTEARRTALTVIESAGLWDEGVRQLERIVDTEGEETRFELAKMLFKAGRFDESETSFRDYASNSVAQGEAWWRVAGFYEAHANVAAAEDAFNSAVSASPQSDTLVTERGRFRILIGRIADGQQDFETARGLVDHARKGGVWRVEVEALLQVGRFAEARDASRKALQVAFLDREYFARVAAQVELGAGDSARAQRFIDELRSGGLPTEVMVDLLVEHGHLEAAAAAIEDEIRNGDYTMAGDLALTHADVFTRLGGIDRLLRTLQPLVERGHDGRLLGSVGEYLVSEGQYGKGVLYLRAAVDQGSTQYRSLLVQTYLILGHEGEAVGQLQAVLIETPEGRRGTVLASLAPFFEVLNLRPTLRGLLEQLAAAPEFRRFAAPMLVHMLVEDGEVSAALASISSTWASFRNIDEAPTVSDVDVIQTTDTAVAMLQALASEGYLAETAALIESMPSSVRNQDSVRDFALRLAAMRGDDGKAAIEEALAVLGVSTADQMRRLKIAQLLANAGRVEEATGLAEPLLTAGDFDVARESLRTLLAGSRIRHDLKNDSKWVKTFIESHADKAGARSVATDMLTIIADDTLVAELSSKTLNLVPNDANIRVSIHQAQMAGDLKAFKKASDLYWRVANEPVSEVASYVSSFAERHDTEYVDALLSRYQDAFPENWLARSAFIKLNYRIGAVDLARDEIVSYLDSVKYDSQAVQEVFRLLTDWHLWGEVARFVAPKLPVESITTPVLRDIGRANLYLGFKDAGVSNLDKFVAASADPANAAAELAVELMDNGFASEALRYAELAVQKRPARSHGYLVRGMAHVALGQDADEDLKKGLTDGAGRLLALYRIGQLALRAGRKDIADRYLEDLVKTPRVGDGANWLPLALDAYRSTDSHAAGVEFVETHWPALAAGIGVAAEAVVPTLASLYEGAGLVERVFSLYEEGIRGEFVTAPFTGDLPTYRNNLAYVYSTANQHIDDGMHLIGLAMAGDPRRNPSFIDTLGWLYYREGEVDKAYAEVQRALRSSSGSATELVELYQHMAELEERRGNMRKASWIRVFAGLLKSR